MQHSTIERATPDDFEPLLELIREFYELDRHPYDRQRLHNCLPPLLDSDEHGVVWKMTSPADGYAVVTWSYSLESGGREALIDELYVRRREAGLGAQMLRHILDDCRQRAIERVFLETEAHNARVRRFYSRAGFEEDHSIWMSMWL